MYNMRYRHAPPVVLVPPAVPARTTSGTGTTGCVWMNKWFQLDLRPTVNTAAPLPCAVLLVFSSLFFLKEIKD